MIIFNKKYFVIAFVALMNISCTKKPVNKVEVLLPQQCAYDAVNSLNLRDGNDIIEYVLFDANTALKKIFPGYLRIESSKKPKELLIAMANRLASICLPEQTVEYSANVSEEMVGSSVSAYLKNPKNKLIIILNSETYQIIGSELRH